MKIECEVLEPRKEERGCLNGLSWWWLEVNMVVLVHKGEEFRLSEWNPRVGATVSYLP